MKTERIDSKCLIKMLKSAAVNLEAHKAIVNELNVFPVPDGDTGTNMSMTFNNSVQEMLRINHDDLYSVAKTASSGALIGARGNSGVILSQILRGFADGCKGRRALDIEGLTLALQSSVEVAYKAVMKPTEGTILTVIREMSEFATAQSENYDDLELFCKDVMESGWKSLRNTPNLLPILKESGVVDSGGQGLMYLVEGAYKGLINQPLEGDQLIIQRDYSDRLVDDSHMRPEDIRFGYCTEFIIKDAAKADEEDLKNYFESIGDSVLVIKEEDIVKVHLHTDHPGDAFEKGLTFGPLIHMKVDNMMEMVQRESVMETGTQSKPSLPYAFIAVSPGEGISDMLKKIGVTEIISGGQTMNPSTQDFLKVINAINSEEIVIFPNNSNIIMAAEQAKEISEKNIHVIETKNLPQCVTAMLTFNPEMSMVDNVDEMEESIQTVKTGEVTFAVRDTKVNKKKIKKGDIIGITMGDIVSNGNDIEGVAQALIAEMIDENSELISVYYGQDVPEDQANALVETLKDCYDECDVEITYGGQPLYYYILSVE